MTTTNHHLVAADLATGNNHPFTISIPAGAGARSFERDLLDRLLAKRAAPVKTKQKRIRKPSLASVARQASKAGLEVARYDVDPDSGKISVVIGKPVETNDIDTKIIGASEWN